METTRQRVDAIVKDRRPPRRSSPITIISASGRASTTIISTFNRPNVTLVDTEGKGVERITPKGVVVDGKEYPLDCLIYATGFDFMTNMPRRPASRSSGAAASRSASIGRTARARCSACRPTAFRTSS